jgi:hypothetical protein
MPDRRIIAADDYPSIREIPDINCKKNSSLQYFYFAPSVFRTHPLVDEQIIGSARFFQPVEK